MRFVPLILVLSLACAGCEDDDPPTGPSPTPVTVTLAPAEQTNVQGLTILFERVAADTRCPADAMCVIQGDAAVSVNLSLGGVGNKYDLYVNDVSRRRATFQNYQVELSSLQPYPLASRSTDPATYRATLVVTRP